VIDLSTGQVKDIATRIAPHNGAPFPVTMVATTLLLAVLAQRINDDINRADREQAATIP